MRQAIEVLSKHLLKIGAYSLLTAVIVGALSLLLPNYYSSSAIFYPASQDLAKPLLENSSERALQYFGTENDKDRLLSLTHSNKLKDYLIEKHALDEHYDIPLDKKAARTKLRKKLAKHQYILKTEFGGIQMEYEDTSPQLAFDLTNSALTYMDSIGRNFYRRSNGDIAKNIKKSIGELEQSLQQLTDSIGQLKKEFQIVDIDRQGELILENIYTTQNKKLSLEAKLATTRDPDSIRYYKQLTTNFRNQMNKLSEDEKNLRKGSAQLVNIQSEKARTLKTLNEKRELYDAYSGQLQNDYPVYHLEEKPQVSDKKSRPRRSLFVLAAFVLTFLCLSLWTLVKAAK